MNTEVLDEGMFSHKKINDAETIRKINEIKIKANQSIRHVKNGRNALIALAILTLLSAFIVAFFSDIGDSFLFITAGISALIYLFAAILTPKNPAIFLVGGAILWVLGILLNTLFEPTTLMKGLIIKVIIGYYLSLGVSHSYQLKQYKKDLYNLGVPQDEIDRFKYLEKVPLSYAPKPSTKNH